MGLWSRVRGFFGWVKKTAADYKVDSRERTELNTLDLFIRDLKQDSVITKGGTDRFGHNHQGILPLAKAMRKDIRAGNLVEATDKSVTIKALMVEKDELFKAELKVWIAQKLTLSSFRRVKWRK
tara:strand:+ start:40 stop:411 length:372 start_codon:yes stop_codon:yes gene_type:complete